MSGAIRPLQYPVAGYQYHHRPPTPGEVVSLGKVFGLPKAQVKQIAEDVIETIEQWEKFAHCEDVSDKDIESVKKVLVV